VEGEGERLGEGDGEGREEVDDVEGKGVAAHTPASCRTSRTTRPYNHRGSRGGTIP